jgi:hypothetical protein
MTQQTNLASHEWGLDQPLALSDHHLKIFNIIGCPHLDTYGEIPMLAMSTKLQATGASEETPEMS